MERLREWARQQPEKASCLVIGTRDIVTYRELDERSNRVAQLLMSLGLTPGDGIAILLHNDLRFFEIVWGARRLGLYYTTISTHLKPAEAGYIIRDCDAKALFTSAAFTEVLMALDSTVTDHCKCYIVGGGAPGYETYEDALSKFDRYVDLPDGSIGKDFLYSSGTTGAPKGVKRPLFQDKRKEEFLGDWVKNFFKLNPDAVFLSTAPLYHSAPLRFSMRALENGGTVLVLQKFDAELALATIEQHRVTHSQWVPTMFVRLLNLPDSVRKKCNLSSHRFAIHAAAPCPVEIKENMIKWWGPMIDEYYSGTEAYGVTYITSDEWIQRKGSVGRAVLGKIHILDDTGNELPPGEIGNLYFSDGPEFVYHNDPKKTAQSRDARGWTTIGDIGYVDGDGYLYLTDRKAFMIISGGVNIYPQEVENVLATHPDIEEVAVFGIPNSEYGEEVKAIVQLKDPKQANPALAQKLIEYCRKRISHLKCPRSIDFHPSLPRLDDGKLHKRLIKEIYSAHKKNKEGLGSANG